MVHALHRGVNGLYPEDDKNHSGSGTPPVTRSDWRQTEIRAVDLRQSDHTAQLALSGADTVPGRASVTAQKPRQRPLPNVRMLASSNALAGGGTAL
mgnify:CR=1 FL=1